MQSDWPALISNECLNTWLCMIRFFPADSKEEARNPPNIYIYI